MSDSLLKFNIPFWNERNGILKRGGRKIGAWSFLIIISAVGEGLFQFEGTCSGRMFYDILRIAVTFYVACSRRGELEFADNPDTPVGTAGELSIAINCFQFRCGNIASSTGIDCQMVHFAR